MWNEYEKIFNLLVVVYKDEKWYKGLKWQIRRKQKQEGKLFLLNESKNLNLSVLLQMTEDIFYFNENHIGFCVCSNVQNKLKFAFCALSHIEAGMWLCFWPGEIRLRVFLFKHKGNSFFIVN